MNFQTRLTAFICSIVLFSSLHSKTITETFLEDIYEVYSHDKEKYENDLEEIKECYENFQNYSPQSDLAKQQKDEVWNTVWDVQVPYNPFEQNYTSLEEILEDNVIQNFVVNVANRYSQLRVEKADMEREDPVTGNPAFDPRKDDIESELKIAETVLKHFYRNTPLWSRTIKNTKNFVRDHQKALTITAGLLVTFAATYGIFKNWPAYPKSNIPGPEMQQQPYHTQSNDLIGVDPETLGSFYNPEDDLD